ncbi:NTP transferase domain-containing protein [Candidatus Bipolaricaulota bacterium]
MIEAIVLAAGLGTRMGCIKPLIEIDNEPALGIILRRLDDLGIPRTTVVLGRTAGQVQEGLDLAEANVVVNPRPEEGMSRSLAIGLGAVDVQSHGVLILHADMPFVEASTIRAVIDAAENGARMAAPAYRGQRGFPVYFARECFDELLETLDGDVGARAYLARHAEELVLVEVETDGCQRDIDAPEDLPREDIAQAKETLHALHADH